VRLIRRPFGGHELRRFAVEPDRRTVRQYDACTDGQVDKGVRRPYEPVTRGRGELVGGGDLIACTVHAATQGELIAVDGVPAGALEPRA
jgi:hypothetical protein